MNKEKKKESSKSMMRPICALIKNGHGVRIWKLELVTVDQIEFRFGNEFSWEKVFFYAPRDETCFCVI